MSERRRQLPRRDVVAQCGRCRTKVSTIEIWIDGEWKLSPVRCPGCDNLIISTHGSVLYIRVKARS